MELGIGTETPGKSDALEHVSRRRNGAVTGSVSITQTW